MQLGRGILAEIHILFGYFWLHCKTVFYGQSITTSIKIEMTTRHAQMHAHIRDIPFFFSFRSNLNEAHNVLASDRH